MSTLPGIKANKYIREVLAADENLTALVKPENIKVMVLQPTNFPFISIRRSALETVYNKDIPTEDSVTIEITVVANEYSQSMEIAQTVRDILDYKVYLNREENVRITEIRFFDCIEDTVDDVFVQNLTFQLKMQNVED
jgi:hypothetical protein